MRKSIRLLQTIEKGAEIATEKVKESWPKRFVNYVKNIVNDYKAVAVETVQDMKARPVKSSFYVSLITATGVLFKTNPSEREFYLRLTESVTDLALVGDLIRSPVSETAMDNLAKWNNNQHMHYYNLGLCSIICQTNYSSDVALYTSTCKHLKPHWTEFHKTIIDVGVFGKWINLEKAMKNFDINPEEWLENGRPNPRFRFYQNNTLVSWDMKVTK